MILIIDLCWKKDSLSAEEFVKPIERIVKAAGKPARTIHYSEINGTIVGSADKIILCGTALADNEFMKQDFPWIKSGKPLLGICAGMQLISREFGGKILENKEIGMKEIKCSDEIFGKDTLSVYELHGFSASPPEGFEEIASQGNAFKKDLIYGIQFHPEVRNEQVLMNWLNL